jgi:hypothetical protein
VFRDASATVEFSNAMVANATFPFDWGLAFVTIDARLLAEWQLSVVVDRTAPSSYGLSVIADSVLLADPGLLWRRDAVVPTEILQTGAMNAQMPLEIGGGRGSSADTIIQAEWRGGVFGDAPSGVEIAGSLRADTTAPVASVFTRSADYALGAFWLSTPITDTTLPAEWGHLTASATRNDRFPLEMLTTVITNVNVSFHMDIGRKSIGSSLEPDEFECEHEP